MNSSLLPSQRVQQALVGARACACDPALLGPGKKLAGSPGSAVFSDQAWNEIIGRLGLTQRECEIVRRVFDDQTEFAIAVDLGISPHTVHTHFERLHKKLGVGDRVQLILRITQEFLRLKALSNVPQLSLGAHRPAARLAIQRRTRAQAA
jgi:DNA-binding CsgD family transcriptional regulator